MTNSQNFYFVVSGGLLQFHPPSSDQTAMVVDVYNRNGSFLFRKEFYIFLFLVLILVVVSRLSGVKQKKRAKLRAARVYVDAADVVAFADE